MTSLPHKESPVAWKKFAGTILQGRNPCGLVRLTPAVHKSHRASPTTTRRIQREMLRFRLCIAKRPPETHEKFDRSQTGLQRTRAHDVAIVANSVAKTGCNVAAGGTNVAKCRSIGLRFSRNPCKTSTSWLRSARRHPGFRLPPAVNNHITFTESLSLQSPISASRTVRLERIRRHDWRSSRIPDNVPAWRGDRNRTRDIEDGPIVVAEGHQGRCGADGSDRTRWRVESRRVR